MTNKTEDKFYFRRATDSDIENLLLEAESLMDDGFVSKAIPYLRKASNSIDTNTSSRLKKILSDMMREANVRFSRPDQPERFAANGWQTIEAYMQVLAEEFGTPRGKEAAQVMMRAAESLGGNAPAALRTAIRTAATSKNATDRGRAIGQIEDMLESASFSRPGQPDKFDASSLNRGNFAEASTSPMLGKLLSEKVMPEGGWRAVETGGGALVISFEDADLARDFGRRVATKGYNATSPVQAIGRYWNVEVKNGK